MQFEIAAGNRKLTDTRSNEHCPTSQLQTNTETSLPLNRSFLQSISCSGVPLFGLSDSA